MVRVFDRKEWESKAGLLSHLAGEGAHLLVGAEAESPRTFFSFSVLGDCLTCELGIFLSGLGIKPATVTLGDRTILVGHDECLTWVDPAECRMLQSHRLNGVFFRFVTLPRENNEVVVLHELGLVRVDALGRTVWSVDTDIVEDVRWNESGLLVLTLMDCDGALEVHSATGSVTKTKR